MRHDAFGRARTIDSADKSAHSKRFATFNALDGLGRSRTARYPCP
jgi:hypothetical protein